MNQSLKEGLSQLPVSLPVFPLSGVLLLPGGQLPLNIFEDRYLAMIDDALGSDRLIGMIQSKPTVSGEENSQDELFEIGCAGRITSFQETEDNRYLITLTGVSRFRVLEEKDLKNGYRCFDIDWKDFQDDRKWETCLDLDRGRLKHLLGDYFKLHQISCDWEAIDDATDQKLITCLSMICPLEPSEKQALLEVRCCRKRADMFMTMLEMAVRDEATDSCSCH
jgi:Lon protease-like protein